MDTTLSYNGSLAVARSLNGNCLRADWLACIA